MTTVLLTAQTVTPQGVALTWTAPDVTDGVSFTNPDGESILLVKNGSASPVTVTIVTPAVTAGQAIADVTLAVAAGAIGVFRFNPSVIFNDSSGKVKATFSAITDITCALAK